MTNTPHGDELQTASDIARDGLGLELPDSADNVVAGVFRCDADEPSGTRARRLRDRRNNLLHPPSPSGYGVAS